MKMIKAIIRPEKEGDVLRQLELEGIYGMTKMDVLGRGKQRGIQVGNTLYEELSKLMLVIVVSNDECQKAIDAISKAAFTGNYGDGKIFISPMEEVYTIRTGESQK
ncbi:MAG: P-II family nitrogen regulator [Nitrospirae bacterium]|nr:P-II family nitrogen regulator [Nitrospirota bacterium]